MYVGTMPAITENDLRFNSGIIGICHTHVGEALVTIVRPFFTRGGYTHLWSIYTPLKPMGTALSSGESESLQDALKAVNALIKVDPLVIHYTTSTFTRYPIQWSIRQEHTGITLCSGLASTKEEAARAAQQNLLRLQDEPLLDSKES